MTLRISLSRRRDTTNPGNPFLRPAIARFLALAAFFLVWTSGSLLAEEPSEATEGPSTEETRNNRPSVQERLEILEEEVERQKLQNAVKQYRSYGGMGPAASQVYYAEPGLSWGGYGELVYTDNRSDRLSDSADMKRLILYAGYRFNDWIVLNTEIEYEHAGADSSGTGGEAIVEFAYIDFEFHRSFQLSLGLNLVPIGITNFLHEPTTFYSVDRPETETAIIPSTWREMGAIVHGEVLDDQFVYRVGILTGTRATGFSSSTWIRGGRTSGSRSRADDLAFVGNLEYQGIQGLILGGTFYTGASGQNEVPSADFNSRITLTPGSSTPDTGTLVGLYEEDLQRGSPAPVRVNLAEAHFRYEDGPFSLRGLFARGWMNEDDTRAVNRATGENIGKTVEGAYVEFAFDVLSFFDTRKSLYLFVRNEYVNTQKDTVRRYAFGSEDIDDAICSAIPNQLCQTTDNLARGNRDIGIIEAADPNRELYGVKGVPSGTTDRRILTYGIAIYPHPQLSIKADYEQRTSKSDFYGDQERFNSSNNKIDQFNLGVAFIF